MKTNTSEEQIKAIAAVLRGLHVKLYGQESGDPKNNAQRNLSGRTHYVDDDTLRWHKSRICSSGHMHGGLLFRVTCSDALDMNNTRRGFRTVVFDVFGTTISRPDLENTKSTSAAAIKASEQEEIDLLDHYQAMLAARLQHGEAELAEVRDAAGRLAALAVREAVAA